MDKAKIKNVLKNSFSVLYSPIGFLEGLYVGISLEGRFFTVIILGGRGGQVIPTKKKFVKSA